MSELDWPPRIDLARTPTPLERLDRWSERLGTELWMKRDDLTGVALSGNKVRKLEFLLAEARALGADTVITCGGINSNHARATAIACARLGLRAHLVLRGTDRHPATGNLLLDRWAGAHIELIPPDRWPSVHGSMTARADQLTAEGRTPYLIPEGGSNGLGCMGYARAALELLQDAATAGIRVGRVVHALGSGGTTAGLALGFAAAKVPGIDCVGVCVADDASTFDTKIRHIVEDSVRRGISSWSAAHPARWRALDGYVGPGYAQTTAADLRAHRDVARTEGIVVDPVYTGKAFSALADLPPPSDGVTIFLHTGGIFELFAFADRIDALEG